MEDVVLLLKKQGWDVTEVLCIGAEAVVCKVDFLGKDAVLKFRIPKSYRIEHIDAMIRRKRTQMEALILKRVKEAGIKAPCVLYLDLQRCMIIMEYIHGLLLKEVLNKDLADWEKIARMLGRYVAFMHENDIVHGDLTTSNIFYSDGDLIFFDFGLGDFTNDIEDKAVDLELLYRVFLSSHTKICKDFMNTFLESYKLHCSQAEEIIARFRRIRLMGRYFAKRYIGKNSN